MSYVICFWDKSKLQVNDEVGMKLQEAKINGQIKDFKLGQGLYSLAGIDKIIPKSEAFDVFPTEWQLLKDMQDKTATLPKLEAPKLN
jgi:hypothetical protein